MSSDFHPLVSNPHVLTILGNFWPRSLDESSFPALRRVYSVSSSTKIVVFEHQPFEAPHGQIIFLHGLEGSANAGYIRSLAQAALVRGYGVHRTNLRTCGGTEDLCETMYHSGLTEDTHFLLEQIASRQLGPTFLVGFSLGGNVTLKLLGELGDTDLLAGGCAISTPIDLAACVRLLDKPANRIYARRFLDRLCSRVRRKSQLSPGLYSPERLEEVKTIWQFDDRFTAPLFGFHDAAHYYETQSASGYLDAIRAPTLVLCAKDDPLVPFSVYQDHPAFRTNSALRLVAPDHGGHLGFIARGKRRFWLDDTVLNWIDEVRAGAIHGTNYTPAASA